MTLKNSNSGISAFEAATVSSALIRKPLLILCLLLATFTSCKVNLIGPYDAVTDQSIQKIQTDVFTIFARLERNISDNLAADNDYRQFKPAYEQLAGELETLKFRCNHLPKHDIIQEQITALADNVKTLERLHKTGISNMAILQPVKSAFNEQFKAMIMLQNGLKKTKDKS
jgi:hypothetical protein